MPGRRILVIRPGALGDTLLTIDALQALRAQISGADIELVGNAAAGALLHAGRIVEPRAETTRDRSRIPPLRAARHT